MCIAARATPSPAPKPRKPTKPRKKRVLTRAQKDNKNAYMRRWRKKTNAKNPARKAAECERLKVCAFVISFCGLFLGVSCGSKKKLYSGAELNPNPGVFLYFLVRVWAECGFNTSAYAIIKAFLE